MQSVINSQFRIKLHFKIGVVNEFLENSKSSFLQISNAYKDIFYSTYFWLSFHSSSLLKQIVGNKTLYYTIFDTNIQENMYSIYIENI